LAKTAGIEAGTNEDATVGGEDEFQRHRRRGSAFVVVGLGEFLGAEMDRQKTRCGGRLRSGDGRGL